MIRLYDLKKSANNQDYLQVSVYRFRGDMPLVIRIYPHSRQSQIFPAYSHSQTMICEELRALLDLLEHPHWRSMVQSLCLQKNTDSIGTAELFADLY